MSSPVVAVRPASPVSAARNTMLRKRIKHLAVLERGKVVGVISMRDIVTHIWRETRARSLRPLDSVPVARLMSVKLVSVSSGTDILRAAKLMAGRGVGSVLVLDEGRVVGIVTETDITRAVSMGALGKRRVGDVMERDPVSVKRRHSLSHIIKSMTERGVKGAVVVEGEKPIGTITSSEIAFAEMGKGERMVRYTRKVERAGRPMARHVRKVLPAVAEDIMRKDPVTVQVKDDVSSAATLMLERNLDFLPVMDEKRLAGALTKAELVRTMAKRGEKG